MTTADILQIATLLTCGYVIFMLGAMWESRSAHKRFMKFIKTSEITKYGEY